MQYLYVLDYSDDTINRIDINENIEDCSEAEEILRKYGFNVNTCSFMWSERKTDCINIID